MRDHDKAHGHGKAAGLDAASVAHAPGKDTQPEHHAHHAHAAGDGKRHGGASEEKTHAIKYAKKFGELAHKLGMVYIAAPTQKWFNADARFADIIDLQLQGRETHTRAYAAAIRKAVNFAEKHNPDLEIIAQISSNKNHLDPDHSGNIDDGIDKAERDILENIDMIDGFWGYLYQQNGKSIRAGQRILKDLARKREKGVKV
jgi:hypothetical protein